MLTNGHQRQTKNETHHFDIIKSLVTISTTEVIERILDKILVPHLSAIRMSKPSITLTSSVAQKEDNKRICDKYNDSELFYQMYNFFFDFYRWILRKFFDYSTFD